MRRARLLARGLAVAVAVLTLFPLLEPLDGLRDVLRTALDPSVSFVSPTGPERVRQNLAKLLYPCAFLAFAALVWLVADIHQVVTERVPESKAAD
jgi:hypothetical protein